MVIEVMNSASQTGLLSLRNAQGQLLHKIKISASETRCDLSHLSPGLYLLEWQVDEKRKVEKILLQ
ncbi:MAG: T9SS type A sorting domain-containing protein [Owenweeksia sp.]|nr:T9SS type A sorting domain-containing protein [Owenweeksia sp.]